MREPRVPGGRDQRRVIRDLYLPGKKMEQSSERGDTSRIDEERPGGFQQRR